MSRPTGAVTVTLLVLCAVIMAAILAIELLNPPRLREAGPVAQSSQVLPGNEQVGLLENFAIPPLGQYDQILERPLFLNTRRAPEVVPETTQKQSGDDGELRLLGVVLSPEQVIALLQVDGSGKAARLRIGEKANGWQLESVSASNVVLRKGETVRNLPLVRSKKTTVQPDRMRKVEKKQNPQSGVPTAAPTEASVR